MDSKLKSSNVFDFSDNGNDENEDSSEESIDIDVDLDLGMDLKKYLVYPIDPKFAQFYLYYKKQEAANWGVDEIDFSKDRVQWNHKNLTKKDKGFVAGMLDKREKKCLERPIIFFVFADPMISRNLSGNFIESIDNIYIEMAWRLQAAMEDRHAETYSLAAHLFIGNEEEIRNRLETIKSMTPVRKKIAWIKHWTNVEKYDFPTRILAMAIVEGLFFTASFAVIDYFAKDDRMSGLAQSNRLIRLDEFTHRELGIDVYLNEVDQKPNKKLVLKMVKKAVEYECEFASCSLVTEEIDEKTGEKIIQDGFPGLNSKLMHDHIKYVADQILTRTVGKKFYNCENPLEFTFKGEYTKANFFEKHETSYQTAGAMRFAMQMIENAGAAVLTSSNHDKTDDVENKNTGSFESATTSSNVYDYELSDEED